MWIFETVVNLQVFFREVCENWLRNQKPSLIGGEGEIVEIDESQFKRCKYNRGRNIAELWGLEEFNAVQEKNDSSYCK